MYMYGTVQTVQQTEIKLSDQVTELAGFKQLLSDQPRVARVGVCRVEKAS
jgi:hypothetical protein